MRMILFSFLGPTFYFWGVLLCINHEIRDNLRPKYFQKIKSLIAVIEIVISSSVLLWQEATETRDILGDRQWQASTG